MERSSMRTGASLRLGSRGKDWQSLALHAERKRSSATQIIPVVSNARSLGGFASSRMLREVAKDPRIPLQRIQKISPHDQPHQALIPSYSRLSNVRRVNLSPLDRLCAEQHQTQKPIHQSASGSATLISPQLHQRLLHDPRSKSQYRHLTLGLRHWSPVPSTITCSESGR